MLTPNRSAELSWGAREVVREIDDLPHLLVRVDVRGPYFPHRAREASVRIVADKGQDMTCWFADIADDGRRLLGYFPTDLPDRGVVEFGYGSETIGSLPVEFDARAVTRLDRDRLPEDLVVVTSDYLEAKGCSASGDAGLRERR
jgi:hypothetical protein